MAKSNSRCLLEFIRDLSFKNNKMAFISGRRQVGKTTLSKQLTQFQKTILHFSKFTKHKLHIQICHAKNHFQVFNVGDLKVVVVSLDHILHLLP